MKFTVPLTEQLIYKGIQVAIGIVIIIFAHIIAKIVSSSIMKLANVDFNKKLSIDGITKTEQAEQTSKTNLVFLTLGNISYYAVLILAFFIVLKVLGIESTSLIALLGTTGLAIGLAIQGTLSDISSGVLLAILQTYSIGETIEVDGNIGKVVDFTILNTVIEDIDTNTIITIPNRKIQESIIQNHTRTPTRYVVFDISISNAEKDIDKIRTSITKMLLSTDGVLVTPPPSIEIEDVNQWSTTIRIKVGINSKDYGDLDDKLRTKIRETLIENKIQLKS
jgi:small conductance mechanosensitive channel